MAASPPPGTIEQRARLVIVGTSPRPAAHAARAASMRWNAISAALARHPGRPASILIEGILAGAQPLAEADITVHVLGFGCPCCIGSLPLQVTLTRILRQERPQLIVLAPLAGAHHDALVTFLTEKFSQFLDVELSFPE
jgi:hypothetical protein